MKILRLHDSFYYFQISRTFSIFLLSIINFFIHKGNFIAIYSFFCYEEKNKQLVVDVRLFSFSRYSGNSTPW
jgi:hypothetical protein